MIETIEESGSKWQEAIINSIDFGQASSFSEYETLGTFIEHNFFDEIEITDQTWQRYGNGLIGSPANLKYFSKIISKKYDFVSFEKWDKPYSYYKKHLEMILRMPQG